MYRHAAGTPYAQQEVLRYLGAPDQCAGTDGSEKAFAYFSDNRGVQDGLLVVIISETGRVKNFGWNNRTEFDFSEPIWHPFDSPTR